MASSVAACFQPGENVWTTFRGRFYQATVLWSDHLLTRIEFLTNTGRKQGQTMMTDFLIKFDGERRREGMKA